MRKFILLFSIVVCTACQQPYKKPTTEVARPVPSKLESFLNSFIKAHPHINENDIYNEKAQVDFKQKAVAFIADSSGLSSIKMEIISTQKNPNGKGYITHFSNVSSYDEQLINKIHIDIFALSDEATALKYNKNTHYILKNYKKVKYLKSEMIQYLTGDRIWTDNAKIDTRQFHEDVSFGNYVIEI